MILYMQLCNIFICKIGKYAGWPINGRREKNFSVSLSRETNFSFEVSWNIHIKNLHIENDVLTHLRIHHQTSKCKVDG